MKRSIISLRWAALGLAASLIAACGGGGGGGGPGGGMGTSSNPYGGGGTATGPVANGTSYQSTALVSDGSVSSTYRDASLKNTWGLAFNPVGFAWVADNGSNQSTLYNGSGLAQSPTVAIPAGTAGAAGPTGIVYNGSSDFAVSKAAVTGASQFIFAGLSGTIAGWSPNVDLNNAVTAFDGGAAGDEFTGLAISSSGGVNYLYAADFHHGVIDVFGPTFAKVTLTGTFTDPGLPAGYAPFNVQAIGNLIYVTYAMQDGTQTNAVAGAGLGLVDVFNPDGTFVKELIIAGPLNAPWGIAMAPNDFGPMKSDLLVANLGDGTINAFDPNTGAAKGALRNSGGAAVTIDGLWGIAFGNGINNQPTNTLFYAAGPNLGAGGVFGRIDPH
jgi:uncharacterized protein (TIGR03118 family)